MLSQQACTLVLLQDESREASQKIFDSLSAVGNSWCNGSPLHLLCLHQLSGLSAQHQFISEVPFWTPMPGVWLGSPVCSPCEWDIVNPLWTQRCSLPCRVLSSVPIFSPWIHRQLGQLNSLLWLRRNIYLLPCSQIMLLTSPLCCLPLHRLWWPVLTQYLGEVSFMAGLVSWRGSQNILCAGPGKEARVQDRQENKGRRIRTSSFTAAGS